MGSNIGVIIGVIVLLVSIGFVVLMMVGEWSQSGQAPETAASAALPQDQAPVPASRRRARGAAPKPKKKAAPKKKKMAKKSRKR